jgi:signal transduction histidine kinase
LLIRALSASNVSPAEATAAGHQIGAELALICQSAPEALERSLVMLSEAAGQNEYSDHLLAGVSAGYDAAAVRSPRRELAGAGRDEARRLKTLRDASLAILSAGSLSESVRLALDYVLGQEQGVGAAIALVGPGAQATECFYVARDGYRINTSHEQVRTDILARLKAGRHNVIRDLLQEAWLTPDLKTMIEHEGRSVLTVPLRAGGAFLGYLSLVTGDVRDFSDDEIDALQDVASSLAVAVQNRRLFESEQRARRREEALRRLTSSITSGLRLDTLLSELLVQLDQIIASQSSMILLGEADTLSIVAEHNVTPALRKMSSEQLAALGGIADVLQTHRSLIIPDVGRHPNWVRLKGGEDIQAWLGVPLIFNGRFIGILALYRSKPATFDEHDAELVEAVANQAAIAIDNARLFQQVERHAAELEQRVSERTRRLEVLYAMAALAGESLDLPTVLERSLDVVGRAFPGMYAAVHLLQRERLELAAATGDHDPAIFEGAMRALESLGLLDEPVEPLAVCAVSEDKLARAGLGEWIDAYAGALMVVRGRVVGVLSLFHPRTDGSAPPSLGADDQSLLAAIADQMGLSVEHTLLRRQSKEAAILEERERLAQELHDIVTQSLYSVILFADAAGSRIQAHDWAAAERDLASIAGAAQRALGEMRLLMFDLRSGTLARKGLVTALDDRLRQVEERAGIAPELLDERIGELPGELEDTVYLIALDALNNVLRHSGADWVRVRLWTEEEELVMEVEDNGGGFDAAGVRGGQGLANMNRRTQAIGGQLSIASWPGRGTRVTVRLPMKSRRDR